MTRTSSRYTFIAAGLTVGALLASCTAQPIPSATTSTSSHSTAHPSLGTSVPSHVTTNLQAPWSVVFLDGTPLVSERDSARILELAEDGTAREIGTVTGVTGSGEGGLLGMAVDDQSRLYVYSTASSGNRIQRYSVTGTAGSLSLGEPQTIIDQIPAAGWHDGGRIAFGPDGMLYAATGDAGQRGTAQDPASLAGKILRMTPDGDVPEDNPFPDSLTYSYGHRNPQGLAWSDDGTMFATEFGQDTWDELNIITPGGNYGWPTVEGIADTDGFTDPVQQWEPSEASPSGMVNIEGTLFIANLRGQVLRAVPSAQPATSTDYFSGEYGRIRDVAESPDGDLWLITNNTDGRGEPGPEDDRILRVHPSMR
ncbi:PQQ-dependent sugar dehydrogenase [Rhodococcus sp. AD45-ID]|uniref:PQQ-dependent sugar dehydrogenase n=1 Tax=Rhodococcus sp. AD45-ID TaxID=2127033 RepID=UPI0005D44E73|nr:PQQ-dependent sugar dehydrogenase [Rhodococcus sp. AD45-ID]